MRCISILPYLLQQPRFRTTVSIGGTRDILAPVDAPAQGIAEDPVTGSVLCSLAPYWSERLGKTILRARQVSRRGGELVCEVAGDRVRIAGKAVLVLTGMLRVPRR